jgi:hypothetical protein
VATSKGFQTLNEWATRSQGKTVGLLGQVWWVFLLVFKKI